LGRLTTVDRRLIIGDCFTMKLEAFDLVITNLKPELHVRLGLLGEDRQGPAQTTLRKGNVSVGLAEGGIPKFVRMRNARFTDDFFESVYDESKEGEEGKELSAETKLHIVDVAIRKMLEVMSEQARLVLLEGDPDIRVTA